jgi:hypothetical protein
MADVVPWVADGGQATFWKRSIGVEATSAVSSASPVVYTAPRVEFGVDPKLGATVPPGDPL